MQAAPLFEDVADAPAGGQAHWLTTADGVRIRVAHWTHEQAKGTVLMFPGRTEYIEKYGRAAQDFHDRGFAMVAIDWRGQGIADRLADDRGLGHVGAFQDYQFDVEAALAHVRALGLPEPYYLVAHSMGGAIGLRAVMNGLPVKAAMFSAPMWGISMSLPIRPFAWVISTVSRQMGFDGRVSPGQDTVSYLDTISFADNELTNDPEMFVWMQAQQKAHPDLCLGGPSLRWLNEALWEMRAIHAAPSPDLPALTWLGTDETIVDPTRIRSKMALWPKGQLVVIPGGKHEMMMDTPQLRSRVYDETAAFFDAHR